MKRRYNFRPSKSDNRDFKYSMLRVYKQFTLPTSIDLTPLDSPIMDQGDEGACTGHAAVGLFNFIELKDIREKTPGPETFDPNKFSSGSRQFVYYNERLDEGTINQDSGAELKNIIASMTKYGVCKEELWPYSESNMYTQPSAAAYFDALSHKVSVYYRLNNLDDMKHCLASGYPFIFGFMVPESFESDEVAKTGIMQPLQPNEQYVGGHEVMAIGYDDATQMLLVRNSWGADWGLKGYFKMPYSRVINPNLTDDPWTFRK